MCACPHCNGPASMNDSNCMNCGGSLQTRVVAPLPARTTPESRVRLVDDPHGAVVLRRIVVGEVLAHMKRDRNQALAPVPDSFVFFPARRVEVWRDIIVPLVAFVFVISTVLQVAAALGMLGISLRGMGITAVLVAGALLAEESWLNGHWRAGLVAMMIWTVVLWMVAVGWIVV